MFPSYVTPIIGLTVEGQVTRFAGYRDAAVKFHVTFKSRVNFIIFATFFANEGSAFSVNRLDMPRQSALHVEGFTAVVAVEVFRSFGRHVALADVGIERSFGEEIRATGFADVRFLPRVGSHVV